MTKLNAHAAARSGGLRLDRPIVLVGMMGSGKTTIGRRLARRLRLRFADADAEIEQAASLSIGEIFAQYGEASFRDGERRVIHRLLRAGPSIIATGGGAFAQDATRRDILDHGISVWIDVPLDILVERTAKRNTRPLLRSGNPEDILRNLMTQRAPAYEQADIRVACGPAPHAQAVEAIVEAVRAHLA